MNGWPSVAGAAKRTFEVIGLYRALLAAVPYRGVAVLCYHGIRDDSWRRGTMRFENLHVTTATLDAHCRVLRALGCSLLSLGEWQEIAAGRRSAPPRAVMLTFDDGYRSVLTRALPVLARYEVPAAVFVCAGPVARGTRFWFDALAERDGEAMVERAKQLSFGEWRALASQYELAADSSDPHAPLTVADLRTLAGHRLIAIGSHTVGHPILARASESEQREEIETSRRLLESWLDRPVSAFAYPNGRPGLDFTDVTVEAVRAAGFDCAFAMRHAFADPRGPRYAYPRLLMLDSTSGPELAHRLSVSWRPVEAAAC